MHRFWVRGARGRTTPSVLRAEALNLLGQPLGGAKLDGFLPQPLPLHIEALGQRFDRVVDGVFELPNYELAMAIAL